MLDRSSAERTSSVPHDLDAQQPSIELLGNKRSLVSFIFPRIAAQVPAGATVLDPFTGTGTVAAALKAGGYRVVANDHLTWCATFAASILYNNEEPLFSGLRLANRSAKGFTPLRRYLDVLAELNRLPPQQGFIYRNYSPASRATTGVERRYFTEWNAGRIDAIRTRIEQWRPQLTEGERALLLTDLLRAATAVSNVAGTYGCYLKAWKRRALEPFMLTPARFVPGSFTSHTVACEDAATLLERHHASVVYADPPYTKRQHAAYYHILETIVLNDRPTLSGTTGLRPWHRQASEFCYKAKAPGALRGLLERTSAEHFFLSYNEDGQIPHETIMAILSEFGRVRVSETLQPRYRSSRLRHKGASVTERLYHLRR